VGTGRLQDLAVYVSLIRDLLLIAFGGGLSLIVSYLQRRWSREDRMMELEHDRAEHERQLLVSHRQALIGGLHELAGRRLAEAITYADAIANGKEAEPPELLFDEQKDVLDKALGAPDFDIITSFVNFDTALDSFIDLIERKAFPKRKGPFETKQWDEVVTHYETLGLAIEAYLVAPGPSAFLKSEPELARSFLAEGGPQT